MNSFLGAVVFLTRIPVSRFYDFQRDNLSRSVIYFPIVGMFVGLAGGIVLTAGHLFLPALIAVLLCMAATVAMTGGIHEDGLADAADGLFGGQNASRCLEIMKDSRLGTFGALALWFSLTGKLLLLYTLLERSVWLAFAAIVMANTLGRGACVALLYFYPYVRVEESKAKPFGDSVTRGQLLPALAFPAALAFALMGRAAASCVLAAVLVTGLAGIYFKRKIGGVTGDCLGATNQLVELASVPRAGSSTSVNGRLKQCCSASCAIQPPHPVANNASDRLMSPFPPKASQRSSALRKKPRAPTPGRVLSSDLRRCRMLADAIAAKLDIRPEPDAIWREVNFGAWENRTWDEIRSHDPHSLAAWMDDFVTVAPPGGESFHQLQSRVVSALQKIDPQPSDNLLVVTHGGVIRAAVCAFSDLPLRQSVRIGSALRQHDLPSMEDDHWSVVRRCAS